MRDIPRFTATEQVPQTRITPVTAGAKGLIAIGESVSKLGAQRFVAVRTQEAKQAGEEAGLTGGPLRLPPATTQAQQAFNNAALAVNRQMTATDIVLNTNKMRDDAFANNRDATKAMSQFNQNAQVYSNELINKIPVQNRAFAQNMLTYHIGQANTQLRRQSLKQQRLKANVQMITNLETSKMATMQSINSINFNTPPDIKDQQIQASQKLLHNHIQGIELAQAGALFSPKEAEKHIDIAIKQYNEQFFSKQFENALQHGKGKEFLDNFDKKNIPGLQEIPKDNLKRKLLRIAKDRSNSIITNKANMADKGKTYLIGLQNGAERSPRTEQDYCNVFPEKCEVFDRNVQDSQIVHSSTQSVIASPLSEQDAELASIKPKRTDPDFGRKIRNFNRIQQSVNTARNQINNDAAQFFNNRPEVVHSLNNKLIENGVGVAQTLVSQSGFSPTTTNPHELTVTAEAQWGLGPSQWTVASKPIARNIVSQMQKLSPSDMIKKFSLLQSEYQKTFPILMNDLVTKGKMPVTMTLLSGIPSNSPTLPLITESVQKTPKEIKAAFPEADKRINKEKVPDAMKNFISSMSTFPNKQTVKYVGTVNSAVKNLAVLIRAKQGVSPSTAYESAYDDLIGFRFNVPTINGSPVRIPTKYSARTITDYANFTKNSKLKDFPFVIDNQQVKNAKVELQRESSGDPELLKNVSKSIRNIIFKSDIEIGHWATNRTNTGLTWVNKYGGLVHDKNGNPFQINFDDAHAWAQNRNAMTKEIQSTPYSQTLKQIGVARPELQ